MLAFSQELPLVVERESYMAPEMEPGHEEPHAYPSSQSISIEFRGSPAQTLCS